MHICGSSVVWMAIASHVIMHETHAIFRADMKQGHHSAAVEAGFTTRLQLQTKITTCRWNSLSSSLAPVSLA